MGSVTVSIVQFNCYECTMGQKYFWRRILVITAPVISRDIISTHCNCRSTKNSWRISKWIRIDEDNLHISRMHLAQNLELQVLRKRMNQQKNVIKNQTCFWICNLVTYQTLKYNFSLEVVYGYIGVEKKHETTKNQ